MHPDYIALKETAAAHFKAQPGNWHIARLCEEPDPEETTLFLLSKEGYILSASKERQVLQARIYDLSRDLVTKFSAEDFPSLIQDADNALFEKDKEFARALLMPAAPGSSWLDELHARGWEFEQLRYPGGSERASEDFCYHDVEVLFKRELAGETVRLEVCYEEDTTNFGLRLIGLGAAPGMPTVYAANCNTRATALDRGLPAIEFAWAGLLAPEGTPLNSRIKQESSALAAAAGLGLAITAPKELLGGAGFTRYVLRISDSGSIHDRAQLSASTKEALEKMSRLVVEKALSDKGAFLGSLADAAEREVEAPGISVKAKGKDTGIA